MVVAHTRNSKVNNLIDFSLSFCLPLRFDFDIADDSSFFSTRSPPSSPRACPISPSHGSPSLLPMDEDFIDLSSIIDKENKPYSPARKRLTWENLPSTTTVNNSQKILQPLSTNIRRNSLKRSESSSLDSPVQNKRYKSENQPPASTASLTLFNSPAVSRKGSISIMNVLTSSTEHLRKHPRWTVEVRQKICIDKVVIY